MLSRPRDISAGISRAAAAPRAMPAHQTGSLSASVTNRVITATAAALVACARTNATTITATRPRATPLVRGAAAAASGSGSARAVRFAFRFIATVVATFATAMTPMARSTEALPNQPISAVATGGPATHANENTARVLITSRGPAPVARRCAKSSELPTPAGAPNTTRATTASGRLVARASAAARATVIPAATSSDGRYSPRRSARAGIHSAATNPAAL